MHVERSSSLGREKTLTDVNDDDDDENNEITGYKIFGHNVNNLRLSVRPVGGE